MSRRYLQSLTNDTVHPLSLKHKTGYKIYDYVEKLIDYQQTQQVLLFHVKHFTKVKTLDL